MRKCIRFLPWVSLASSVTLLTYAVAPRATLATITASSIATLFVALREACGKPVAIAVTKSFALDLGGFVAPLMAVAPLALLSNAHCALMSIAIYSLIASILAEPRSNRISVNTLAYSIPTSVALLTLFGRDAALCIPLASFLGIFLYVDIAYYLAIYRKNRGTFVAGGAGALDALVVGPALSCCTALALVPIVYSC